MGILSYSLMGIILRAHTTPATHDDFMNDDMDSYLIAMDNSITSAPSAPSPPMSLPADSICSKPATAAVAIHRTRLGSSKEEDETEKDNSARPPNKKVCFSFPMEEMCGNKCVT